MKGIFTVQLYCYNCSRMCIRENVSLIMGQEKGFGCLGCEGKTVAWVPIIKLGHYQPFVSRSVASPIAIGFTRKG